MKLNVLHLRLTDDYSFVIESKRYPGLNKGQPHNKMYSQDDIKKLIAYARARGVRIVPVSIVIHSSSHLTI
jgi:hexosaminidase